MTNRLVVHILRMRSRSCVNRRRLHLASSRIYRMFYIKLRAKNVMHRLTRRRKLDKRRPCVRARGGPEIYSRP